MPALQPPHGPLITDAIDSIALFSEFGASHTHKLLGQHVLLAASVMGCKTVFERSAR